MYWRIKYVLDDGFDWYKKICIINADDKEEVFEIFNNEINSKLKGGQVILNKYTEIIKCENNTILYDGQII